MRETQSYADILIFACFRRQAEAGIGQPSVRNWRGKRGRRRGERPITVDHFMYCSMYHGFTIDSDSISCSLLSTRSNIENKI